MKLPSTFAHKCTCTKSTHIFEGKLFFCLKKKKQFDLYIKKHFKAKKHGKFNKGGVLKELWEFVKNQRITKPPLVIC